MKLKWIKNFSFKQCILKMTSTKTLAILWCMHCHNWKSRVVMRPTSVSLAIPLCHQWPRSWRHDTFLFSTMGKPRAVTLLSHDDVIKCKHIPRYWHFVRGIHRSPVNSPHKSRWRGALMFSVMYAWINGLANNRKAGDLRHHRAHYDVTVMHAKNALCMAHSVLKAAVAVVISTMWTIYLP